MRQLKIKPSITNREQASLEKYLQEIGREQLVTTSEEVVLAVRIKKGDEQALDKLVRVNLRFVVSVAKQYQHQGLSLLDLINEGNLGLIKAAKKFDETKGFKFISYAVWWIRQMIMKALAEQARIVRLPLNKLGAISKIRKINVVLEQKNERYATYEEISSELGMSVDSVIDAVGLASDKHVSYDAPIHDGEDITLLDSIENTSDGTNPTDVLLEDSMKKEIRRSIQTLTPREIDVIRLFYGIGEERSFTLEEIGERFGLTRERVRQIKEKAIRRLRHTSRSKNLVAYLSQ